MIFLGALTNLSAASWCLPKDFQTGIMTAYGLAAVFGLQKALTAWTPVARRMCFAPVFVSRILAFILRLSSWGGGNPDILIHVILQVRRFLHFIYINKLIDLHNSYPLPITRYYTALYPGSLFNYSKLY